MKTLALVLLGTTLLAAPALAQSTAPDAAPAAPAAPATQNRPAADNKAAEAKPMFEMRQGQWRSTKVVGLSVYNNNNESIGDINDLILSKDGKIEAVVIGVGGFLGIGEKSVAVPYAQVQFSDQPRQDSARTASADANRANANPPAAGTTGSVNTGATTGSTTTAGTASTTSSAGTTRTASADNANRGYPDHAMVNMSKDQLQALPEVRYDR